MSMGVNADTVIDNTQEVKEKSILEKFQENFKPVEEIYIAKKINPSEDEQEYSFFIKGHLSENYLHYELERGDNGKTKYKVSLYTEGLKEDEFGANFQFMTLRRDDTNKDFRKKALDVFSGAIEFEGELLPNLNAVVELHGKISQKTIYTKNRDGSDLYKETPFNDDQISKEGVLSHGYLASASYGLKLGLTYNLNEYGEIFATTEIESKDYLYNYPRELEFTENEHKISFDLGWQKALRGGKNAIKVYYHNETNPGYEVDDRETGQRVDFLDSGKSDHGELRFELKF